MKYDEYINEGNNLVPENTIAIVPHNANVTTDYDSIILDLKDYSKRDWFTSHFYYCLPILIGNQYGFAIKSMYDVSLFWDGSESPAGLTVNINGYGHESQYVVSNFGSGVVTFQNNFTMRTPPGINIMTIQPPNYFIKNIGVMTAVIETDNLRRDFSFNLKVIEPNKQTLIQKGDIIAAFIPIQRYFVDGFQIKDAKDLFSQETLNKEYTDQFEFGEQRRNQDKDKPHQAGRRYFNGVHAFGQKYKDHQKRVAGLDKK